MGPIRTTDGASGSDFCARVFALIFFRDNTTDAGSEGGAAIVTVASVSQQRMRIYPPNLIILEGHYRHLATGITSTGTILYGVRIVYEYCRPDHRDK
jgi:hypothetical protein